MIRRNLQQSSSSDRSGQWGTPSQNSSLSMQRPDWHRNWEGLHRWDSEGSSKVQDTDMWEEKSRQGRGKQESIAVLALHLWGQVQESYVYMNIGPTYSTAKENYGLTYHGSQTNLALQFSQLRSLEMLDRPICMFNKYGMFFPSIKQEGLYYKIQKNCISYGKIFPMKTKFLRRQLSWAGRRKIFFSKSCCLQWPSEITILTRIQDSPNWSLNSEDKAWSSKERLKIAMQAFFFVWTLNGVSRFFLHQPAKKELWSLVPLEKIW